MIKGAILVFIAFLGVNITEGSPISDRIKAKCGGICPLIISPVCGSDGKEYRLFINDCQLNAYNCYQQKSFETVKTELCTDEDLGRNSDCAVCPEIWAPVCGSDGFELRTFASNCYLENANCIENRSFTRVKSGKCDAANKSKKPCRKICTRIYKPVCGSDGVETKSFPNLCELVSLNCTEFRNFHITKEGTC